MMAARTKPCDCWHTLESQPPKGLVPKVASNSAGGTATAPSNLQCAMMSAQHLMTWMSDDVFIVLLFVFAINVMIDTPAVAVWGVLATKLYDVAKDSKCRIDARTDPKLTSI